MFPSAKPREAGNGIICKKDRNGSLPSSRTENVYDLSSKAARLRFYHICEFFNQVCMTMKQDISVKILTDKLFNEQGLSKYSDI